MSPDPLMASAHVADPQSWNRYSYAHNNPLRFIDPDGMTDCQADGDKCIHVKLNVIYDKNANLSDKQKQQFEKQQLALAQKQYGTGDIKLDVSYTAGSINYDSSGNFTGITGCQKGGINVVVTDHLPLELKGATGDAGASYISRSTGIAISAVEIGGSDSTLSHELAHHFLGDTSRAGGFFQEFFSEWSTDLARTSLGDMGRWQNQVYGSQVFDRNTGGLTSRYENFRGGARNFSVGNDQAAIRPRTQ